MKSQGVLPLLRRELVGLMRTASSSSGNATPTRRNYIVRRPLVIEETSPRDCRGAPPDAGCSLAETACNDEDTVLAAFAMLDGPDVADLFPPGTLFKRFVKVCKGLVFGLCSVTLLVTNS